MFSGLSEPRKWGNLERFAITSDILLFIPSEARNVMAFLLFIAFLPPNLCSQHNLSAILLQGCGKVAIPKIMARRNFSEPPIMIPNRGLRWSHRAIGLGRRRVEPFSARQVNLRIPYTAQSLTLLVLFRECSVCADSRQSTHFQSSASEE